MHGVAEDGNAAIDGADRLVGHVRVLCDRFRALPGIQRPGRHRVNCPGRPPWWTLWLPGLLAGCGGEMSILDAAGSAARQQFWIWWAMLGVAVAVSLGVYALWFYTFRRREPPPRTPREERRIMLRWVLGGGIALPVASIIALLVFAAPTGRGMLPLPDDGAERIEVIAHQWWWEVRYPGEEGERDVVTANRLVMPAGEPVDFRLTSTDVIHAFWIPRLGGKRDMIPGRYSSVRLEADSPGVFGAQCAEYCGAQHTHMLLHVEALERGDYDAWLAERRPPPGPGEGFAEAKEAFGEHCAACHTVGGFAEELVDDDLEHDIRGPDLSDIGSRPTLGAGVLPMEEGAIAYWLQHHQTLKPGNRMPAHDHIDTETLQAIGAWLETLEP
ncbi:cytochrome c oxidase subunit II [Billgrantia sulfidoxydans]|uniref:Cytochrome aa3 subunit 2 n=2 Tax=Oceanospirillales TaxID=135619 RepID=A0ABX7W312_9GAMM|nr:cytochrome c oxidase subunit II [Halomonas sulfidoxydans]